MKASEIIFFLVFASTATSWGWGMRGTIIGGEKGAMLPGALPGMVISLFSGSDYLRTNFWLLAGIGAAAMYFGGNMTYSETFNFTMPDKDCYNMKKGLTALFIKGGVWFGIFSGIISMYISVLAGYYSLVKLIVFFACIPVFAFAFYFIFNKPYNPDKKIFPRLYFSQTKKETWGGLFGITVEILIFSAVFKDFSTLIMSISGFLFGGFGWMIAQYFQIRTIYPGKNGKKFFTIANKNGLIDPWKIMECMFGAVSSFGIVLTFICCHSLFEEKLSAIDAVGASHIMSSSVSHALVIVYGLILIADTLQYFILPSTQKKYYKRLLKNNLITKEDYSEYIRKDVPCESEGYLRYKKFCEHSEFPIYSVIPIMCAFFGCTDIMVTISFCVIMLVLCQEICEKCFREDRHSNLIKFVIFVPVLLVFITQLITGAPFALSITMILYTFFYEVAFFLLKLLGPEKSRFSGTEKTVHGYFIICCLVLNAFGLLM